MVQILTTKSFGLDLIRNFFMLLDKMVYGLISGLMNLIIDIAEAPLLDEVFKDVTNRVYMILIIFMLFRITVSMFTYLVNPDTATDKQQGVGKLITRVIVTLMLLIMLPFAFNVLTDIQKPIMRTLPRIVLNTEESEFGNDLSANGQAISWSIFQAFFKYSPDCSANDTSKSVGDGFATSSSSTDIFTAAADSVNDYCGEGEGETQDKGIYKYDYSFIISTLAGGFLCYVLIGIAITVAIRMFKLIILKMIAPIPIISYIDPKSSKDGAFNSWVKLLIQTWTELFVNLTIMYFIIFVVNELILGGGTKGFAGYIGELGLGRGTLFTVFIILGLFMFARQAPKFILDALGIKNSKGGFGKIMAPLAGAVGAGIAGGGLAGMASGALAGAQGAMSDKKLADTWNQAKDLGTKIASGGEESKYKSGLEKIQQSIMQNSAARKLGFKNAKEIGYVDKHGKKHDGAFDTYKKERDDTAANLAAATSALENNQGFMYNGKEYSGQALSDLIYTRDYDKNGKEIPGLRVQAAKAESKFNDFSSYVGRYGMGSKAQTDLQKANDAKTHLANNTNVSLGYAYDLKNSKSSPSTSDENVMDLYSDVQSKIYEQQNQKANQANNQSQGSDGFGNPYYPNGYDHWDNQ